MQSSPAQKIRTSIGLAAVVAGAILTSACGGGGSSPAPAPGPAPGPGPAPAPVVNPIPDPNTGLVGKCSSLSGGSATSTGFVVGYCVTSFPTATTPGNVFEGLFLSQDVPVSVTSAANGVPIYQLPTPASWGGARTLQNQVDQTVVVPGAAAGSLTGGYALDRLLDNPVDRSSLVDYGPVLNAAIGAPAGTATRVSFGLFGRSNVASDVYYGGYYGSAIGATRFTGAALPTLTAPTTFAGTSSAFYLRSANTVALAGEAPVQAVSATLSLQLNSSTRAVTGTLSNFKVRVNSAVTDLSAIAAQSFTGTWDPTTGRFTGEIGAANTLKVEGAFFGPAAEEAAGKFATRLADGRYLVGSFGGRR